MSAVSLEKKGQCFLLVRVSEGPEGCCYPAVCGDHEARRETATQTSTYVFRGPLDQVSDMRLLVLG
jgi:hypothetical protein